MKDLVDDVQKLQDEQDLLKSEFQQLVGISKNNGSAIDWVCNRGVKPHIRAGDLSICCLGTDGLVKNFYVSPPMRGVIGNGAEFLGRGWQEFTKKKIVDSMILAAHLAIAQPQKPIRVPYQRLINGYCYQCEVTMLACCLEHKRVICYTKQLNCKAIDYQHLRQA